jgi:Tfp pilus assembly protein PilN
MSRVNLLPAEIKKGQENRRRAGLFLLLGIAVVALVIGFYVVQGMRLAAVKSDIADQQRTNASLQTSIDGLQKYEQLRVQAQQEQALLDGAFVNEVSYSSMLVDVSKVIPSDTYLTNFASTIDTTAVPAAGSDTTFVGTMTFSGETLQFNSISTWLTRLEGVEGWANPWTSSVSADSTVAGAFTFDTSVDLTQDALTERGKAGQAALGG